MAKEEPDEIQDDWGYFTQIPDVFIEHSSNLSNRARWLFVLLKFHVNKKTKRAFPSYEMLQEETGWSFATIAAGIRDLENTGWLTRQKGFGKNTLYRLVRKDEFDSPLNSEARTKKHVPPKNEGRSSKNQRPVLQEVKTTYMELTQKEFTQTEHEDLNHPKADDSRRESAQAVAPLFSASATPSNTETTDRPPPSVQVSASTVSFDGGSGSGILPQVALFDGGAGSSISLSVPRDSNHVPREKTAIKPKASRKISAKLPPDPRSSHPAIAALRDLAKRFPKEILWDKIIERLGDSPDIEKLRACYLAHVERGYNPNSWVWATEWYGTDIPQSNLKQRKERKYEPIFDFAADFKSSEHRGDVTS